MHNSLLCETQGFDCRDLLQLQSSVSREHTLDVVFILLFFIHKENNSSLILNNTDSANHYNTFVCLRLTQQDMCLKAVYYFSYNSVFL